MVNALNDDKVPSSLKQRHIFETRFPFDPYMPNALSTDIERGGGQNGSECVTQGQLMRSADFDSKTIYTIFLCVI